MVLQCPIWETTGTEDHESSEYYVASIVNIYRSAIDDYFNDPEHYDYKKYMIPASTHGIIRSGITED